LSRGAVTGRAVRPRFYRLQMPRWVVLLAVALVAWLSLSVLGGLLVGRLLDLATRRRRSA